MIETDEDKSKFEEIYQEYRNLMYYVAYKRMQHEQDAEDVVHHVFVKIAENIKNIEPVSPKTKQLNIVGRVIEKRQQLRALQKRLKDSTLFCVGAIVMPKVRVVKNGTS